MTDYSTCRRCHRLMIVLDGDVVHPMCNPLPTKLERRRIERDGLLALLAEFPVSNPEAIAPDLAALELEIKELENRTPDLLAAAMKYARDWGWPVFPLHPGTKQPATPHGFKDATTDIERIARYWRKHPTANIGVPTGLPETFDVIDIDRPKRDGQIDGELAYGQLLKAGELGDTHAHVRTAHAGLHLYVEVDKDEPSGCTTGIEPGIDYRGVGGYVVVPPSVDETGGRWEWLIVPSPVIRK